MLHNVEITIIVQLTKLILDKEINANSTLQLPQM